MSDDDPKRIGSLIDAPRGVRGRGNETPEQYRERCRIEGDRNRAKAERVRELIQKLKTSRDPANEHGTIRALRELDHPDLDGLIGALKARNESSGPATARPRKGM